MKELKAIKKGKITVSTHKFKKDPGIPNLYPFKKDILQKLVDQKDLTAANLKRIMAEKMAETIESQLATNQLVQPH